MAVSYGLTEFMSENVSTSDKIKVLQQDMFPRITKMEHLKDYIHQAGDILGIEFNRDILQTNDKIQVQSDNASGLVTVALQLLTDVS